MMSCAIVQNLMAAETLFRGGQWQSCAKNFQQAKPKSGKKKNSSATQTDKQPQKGHTLFVC